MKILYNELKINVNIYIMLCIVFKNNHPMVTFDILQSLVSSARLALLSFAISISGNAKNKQKTREFGKSKPSVNS